jgi:hypothetical protein
MKLTSQTLGKIVLVLAVVMLQQSATAAPKYIPVASGQFTTGQWYFEGERSSLSGNAYLNLVPALQFSNRFSLIPSFESSYRGTRSAEELAGGSTLFQDTWENVLSVKAVHGLNKNWSLKERVSGRMKWFRETTDESWTDGLYDYNSVTIGAEIERRWNKKSSVAFGYDYSILSFPNYNSLESGQSGDSSREFSGDDVLDSGIQLITLKGEMPLFWSMKSSLQGFYNPRSYNEQTIVQLSGLLSPEKRKDVRSGGNLSLSRDFDIKKKARLFTTLNGGYAEVNSNQNHYDARLTTFVPDFYDYDQKTVGAQLALAFGSSPTGAMVVETGFGYSRRDYRSRVIQSVDGAYLTEKLYISETAINFAFSYPLSKNFRARASSSFGRSKSNNDYEAVYEYDYDNANYQFGFTYEY